MNSLKKIEKQLLSWGYARGWQNECDVYSQDLVLNHFYHTIGEDYFSYPNLYSNMVNRFPSGSHFVEIGSWRGRSAAFMGVEIHNSNKNIKFDAIDPWEGWTSDTYDYRDDSSYNESLKKNIDVDKDWLYKDFLKNTLPVSHIVNPIRKPSTVAAEEYQNESLEFVFIDGDHSYESVKEDILAWLPKVKRGGILAGHDYTVDWPGTIKAVNETIGNTNIRTQEYCWIYEKV